MLLGIVAALVLAGCMGMGGDDGEHAHDEGELHEVEHATESYKDVQAAKEDGYTKFSVFVPGMGFHYLTDSAINADATSALDRSLDRKDPEILVYTGGGNESLELAAVEYAVPVQEGESAPPQQAVDLFSEANASDWHVHPSHHELGLPHNWTVHAECHYEGGAGVFLAENPQGDFVRMTPKGKAGNWSGDVAPDQCPDQLGGKSLPPLNLVHGKWWTLHAWVWKENPKGVFHPTNPDVSR